MEQSATDEAIATGWIDWAKRTNPETSELRERAEQDSARAADDDWASMRLIDIRFDDPDRALRIAIDICHRCDDEWVLCLVGCGPFEDALVGMGWRALDILKIEAAKNDDILYALEHSWQNSMPDDIWLELQRLVGRDHRTAVAHAIALAEACIEGRLTALQTGREMVRYIDPWHPAWEALGGPDGPLCAFFVAQQRADELHFLGDDVEKWHPDVREKRRTELAEAEAAAKPEVLQACKALIDYAARLKAT